MIPESNLNLREEIKSTLKVIIWETINVTYLLLHLFLGTLCYCCITKNILKMLGFSYLFIVIGIYMIPYPINCNNLSAVSFFSPKSYLCIWERMWENMCVSWGKDRGTGRGGSRLPAECGAHQRTWSHNAEIMTLAEVKSWLLNRLSHPCAQSVVSYRPLCRQ